MKMAHLLRQKQIDRVHVENALDQIDDSSYLQACVSVLKLKAASLKEKNQFSFKGKLFRFASGKGYEPDVIYRALEAIDQD
jgi:regulatory protein